MRKIIYLTVLMTILILVPVYALTALTVSWELPRETFRPGSDATIDILLTNTGTADLTNVVVSASSSPYVHVMRGRAELGALKALSTAQASITIRIEEDAPSTTSYISLKVDYYTGSSTTNTATYTIPITIRRDPVFEIENVVFDDDLTPGNTVKFEFDLFNSGMGPARDIVVSLEDDEDIFIITGSSAEKTFDEILGKTKERIGYVMTLDPETDIGITKIPIQLEYYDETNSDFYEETKYIGVKISGDIDLVATVDSLENFYRGSMGKVIISIANRGTAPAEYATVYATSKYGESEFYVGSIDADDYETVELTQNLKGIASNYPIDLNITYKDKFNEQYSISKIVYASATSAPITMGNIFFLIVIGGIVYWLYRKGKLDKFISQAKKKLKK